MGLSQTRLSVDVVIPVHNGWVHTQACLSGLQQQSYPHAVVVVDNGSTDGTTARVRAEFGGVSVVDAGRNIGFSRACNQGVEAGSAELVVLLNNDVESRPDFLE